MSDAAGFAMMSDEDYRYNIRQLQDSIAAADRHERREAAIEDLDGVDTVEYDGETWQLLEIQPDGCVALEQWDDAAVVEATQVRPR